MWNRQSAGGKRRRRIFTFPMADFFNAGTDAWRAEAWQIIKACSNLDWLILTKRQS
jgi:hypothetical protein